jgi:RNA polymerase sigma-70 factor (ECF subfamily)
VSASRRSILHAEPCFCDKISPEHSANRPSGLFDLRGAEVVFLIDAGVVAQAAPAPIMGAGTVARVLGRIAPAASLQPAQVNGHPALIIRLNGAIDTVIAVRIDDGRIHGLFAVRNPEKLSHMNHETALRR